MNGYTSPEAFLAAEAVEVPLHDPKRELNGAATSVTAFRVERIDDFAALDLPPREFVLQPVLHHRAVAMLYAARGGAKTHVAHAIAIAVATGCDCLGGHWRAPRARRVLLVDGEMAAEDLQERLRAVLAATTSPLPTPDHLRVLAMDRQDLGRSINLNRSKDRAAVEAALDGAELLILDNLSTLLAGGDENDASSWETMQAWLLHLRRRGVTVLLVHHAGRNGLARGTSKREDTLDLIVALRRPEDYSPEQGARLEVHFEKSRGVYGAAAAPFEARLAIVDGAARWTVQPLRDLDLDRVEALSREKMTVRDIAEETGLSKSTVSRMQAKLRAEGRL